MSANAEGLRALRDKYLEITRLRAERAAGGDEAPRAVLAQLAARFPGALRELDELPPERLAARLAQLDAALDGREAAPAWAQAQLGYHGWMRFALRAKRLAADGLDTRAILVRLAQDDAQGLGEPHDPPTSALSEALVQAALRPPGGRLNPWVYAHVGRALGLDAEVVRKALFVR